MPNELNAGQELAVSGEMAARSGTRRRLSRRLAIFAAASVLLLLLTPPLLVWAGRWLVVEDPLQKSNVIFVHAGHLPYRSIEAARLYREGWASEVWLAPIAETAQERALADLGIHPPQGWFYSRLVLERLGVPSQAIRLLDTKVLNTKDELEAVRDQLLREGSSRVILVTSKQHSRRVRVQWNLLPETGIEARVRPSSSDPLDPDRWWANTDDASRVLHEYFGILNAWIGSPLRPKGGEPSQ